ncbi:MAG: tetratricopeptide repeat protein [bacterium]
MSRKKFFSIRCDLLVSVVLIISVLGVYWQVKNHAFLNYDDTMYVTQNYYVQTGLTLEGIAWAFTTAHASNWHPLTWISHMMDCELYGMNPGRHHFTNVYFHLMNTILLFFIFLKMTGCLWRSGFIAALFALHPLHVESVAWVAERKDVISTFFLMLTLGAYIWYCEHPDVQRYLLVLLFFSMGLMAKPMLVTLPFVLLLLDYWPLGRLRPAEAISDNESSRWAFSLWRLWEKIPLFILSALSSVVTFLVQRSGKAVVPLESCPVTSRIANALVSYVRYIGKMICPCNLSIIYPYTSSLKAWQVAVSCLFLFSVTVLIILAREKYPYLLVGWFWYLGMLVPVIGIVQVGVQSMADRYTYVPLIGLFIIIAWGVPEITLRMQHRERLFIILASLLLPALMAMTWMQAGYWSDDILLFEHALDVTVDNYSAHNYLGFAYYRQGNSKAAIKHYSRALDIKSDYGEAHNNLGIALEREGRIKDAVKHYFEALRIDPDFASPHGNLGVVFARQGNYTQAIAHFKEALRINPEYINVHYNLGLALAQQGNINDAIAHLQEALRLRPDIACANSIKKKLVTLYRKLEK